MKGYASVALIVFIVMAMTVTTGATIITLVNSLAGSRHEQGIITHSLAENGLENGIIRYLRDPVNYLGETLPLSNGSIQIRVADDKQSITSTAYSGNFVRSICAQVSYSTNLIITSWQEIF